MERFEYAISLKAESANENGFVVTCRDLPQLITQGENQADALEQAKDAMDEVFATYMKQGLEFPVVSRNRGLGSTWFHLLPEQLLRPRFTLL